MRIVGFEEHVNQASAMERMTWLMSGQNLAPSRSRADA
jgi:hypothetical protein